ncbi:flagellar hook protein FlgE [Desulfonatronum sp. SC1]|uniref:flagellar hook protein FlgE n=1 Tax=Desulfonatronum sp. SC1 TaxID=2109626 RepID=UPI000D3141A0|nr:flagellar hook protein FlgE [Desulfonatronum sp. SC1]PTN38685.1 flagellar biosynthesis protein FlgE [Desulfonatronum sp. SC1]
MSLTASMWTGVSGLKGHGQKMGVIGNNIANVSTIGFKGSRMHFEDFMSQYVGVANGVGQVGRGVAVGAILGDFSQGSLETTNESTDVAITGNGFFTVSPPGDDINYYTRAGNFRFDKDGFLVDPHGYRVQGWQIARQAVDPLVDAVDGEGIGARRVNIQGVPRDIQLDNFQSPPSPTSTINAVVNLDSAARSRVDDLEAAWNADPGNLANQQYEYQTTMKIYDANGGAHNVTVYFDKRPDDDPDVIANEPNTIWQFIVTIPPEDDQENGTGLLMTGDLLFNPAGEIINMRADPTLETEDGNGDPYFISRNGYPTFAVNFLGEPQNIEFTLGTRFVGDVAAYAPGAFAGDIADWERSALSTTAYNNASTTLYQTQDGYTAGFLQNISINREGVLTGRYSNGQVLDLYALTINNFNNVWGLNREGGNLFAETGSSGPPLTGIAGTGNLGTVSSNTLELSNVDLATEFVKMISTQKGFQANSKTITTVDTMLDEVIRMKR